MKALRPSPHTFHIPVLGTGFTIDTPLKVAPFGVSSVVSILDHTLLEQMRRFHLQRIGRTWHAIDESDPDFRAKRVTAYLNLMDELVNQRFAAVQSAPFSPGSDIVRYIELQPDESPLHGLYERLRRATDPDEVSALEAAIRAQLVVGTIDVNIMTKVDRLNYDRQKNPLPSPFRDAHSALRGFALSALRSSVVFSAGMNPSLFAYLEQFDDFYPGQDGSLAKRVTLKVSDFRSALVQGKVLAKKGIWVSEYRVESGLNCGGHAFATKGVLAGPILEEFHLRRQELVETMFSYWEKALQAKNRCVPSLFPSITLSYQGGVGHRDEHAFLMRRYGLDSVGWGTPFMLVPEVVSVDPASLELMCKAEEADLYLSNISPLGVPFNTVRTAKTARGDEGKRPGSTCPKKFLAHNTEFTQKPICTASRQYQSFKLREIEAGPGIDAGKQQARADVMAKSCICVGLGNGALIINNLDLPKGQDEVTVCPGPNLAYFSKVVSFREMVDHIYGRVNVLAKKYRPNFLIKELGMYMAHFKQELENGGFPLSKKQAKYLSDFKQNLQNGMAYYRELVANLMEEPELRKQQFKQELKEFERMLRQLLEQYELAL